MIRGSGASFLFSVTTVPAISKIVEKLVHTQLTAYLTHQNLFSEEQHGFMEKHSTCTALLTMTEQILSGMDSSQISILTLIDLSRCFDVIDHEILLKKLELLQITTGWFKSYLQDHIQRVKIGENLSEPARISIGTFQGTCLGPLLSNIATNDLACHIPSEINGFKVTLVRYADDCQLAITGPRNRIDEMRTSLELVLEIMSQWFQQHGMLVNAGKTGLIVCGDRRKLTRIEQTPSIMFMGQQLGCKSAVKNLGVMMDSQLGWESHVKLICDRCFGILIGLAHAKHMLPRDVLPRLIDSLVFSQLRYCIQVFGSANSTCFGKIQSVFNFAARVLSGRRKYDHISDVLRQLGWLNASQFLVYSDLCLLYKVLTSGRPRALYEMFRFNHEVNQRETRQSNHLAVTRPRTNHGKRTFCYRASQLYNNHTGYFNELIDIPWSMFKTIAREIAMNT